MPIKQVFVCDFCQTEQSKCSAMLPNGWTKMQVTLVDSSVTEVMQKNKDGEEQLVRVPKYLEATVLKYACPNCAALTQGLRSAMDTLNGR